MTLKLNGSSSGYTAIDAPAAAGSNTLTLPTSNGSANQYLKNSGTPGALEFATLSTGYTLHTDNVAVGSSSSKTFTGIPAANHIKLIHWGWSFDGSSNHVIKIGNATDGIKSADYFCARIDLQSSQQIHSATDSWKAYGANESAKAYTGQMDIWRIGTSDVYSMDWKMTSSQSTGSSAKIQILHGFVESSTINQIQITGTGGDNFDSGAITIYHI